ncbi:hypothetical protein [Methylosinus sp. PW1]|uniref:hypothetical protein n=1 Tax=Methylosinus sp. PW1 TaxID=107636 RepID=UPI000568417E|nr:hypothetical protein [Methylosinus sp. PW1]
MTIEHDDIEQILGPFRAEKGMPNGVLPLRMLPESVFSHSSDHPVCEWIGDNGRDVLLEYSRRSQIDANDAKEWVNAQPNAHDIMTPTAFLVFPHLVPVLAPGFKWSLIEHQICGTWCRQQTFAGLRLTMREPAAEVAKFIARNWWGTGIGWRTPTLDQLDLYRSQLRRIGLDANTSYAWLSEGFYPVDFSQRALDCIASDAPEFDELLVNRMTRSAEELAIIAIVAPNSD